MGFLAPLWLGALGAIAIPILLHFRAAAPPERIQVGSIADLTPGVATKSRPRLQEWLLLALRILFVALLALLLAHPVRHDERAGRLVAVVPTGVERVGDSLRSAGIEVATPTRATREPWTLASEVDAALGINDTMLLVSPDEGSRYPGRRTTLTHPVRILDVRDSAVSDALPLRVHLVASSPAFAPQRDSVEALLKQVSPTVLLVTGENASDVRRVVVGSDTALGLDATSLGRGGLHRDGAVDSLLTRLLPPAPLAPPLSQRAPRRTAAADSVVPSQDLRALCWWLLLGVFVVERLVASRRR